MMRKIYITLIIFTALLFAAFFIFSNYIGGNSFSGYEQDSVYYVGSYGNYTAVSYFVWIADLVLGISALSIGGLTLLLYLFLPDRMRSNGKLPLSLRARSRIAVDDAIWNKDTVRLHKVCLYNGLFFSAICLGVALLFILLRNYNMLMAPLLAAIFSLCLSVLIYRNYQLAYDSDGITVRSIWGKPYRISKAQIVAIYPCNMKIKGKFHDVIVIRYRTPGGFTEQETLHYHEHVGITRFLEFVKREYQCVQTKE